MPLGLFVILASGAVVGGGAGFIDDRGAAPSAAADGLSAFQSDGLSALLDAADSLGGGGEAGLGLDALLGEMEAAGGDAAAALTESERRRAQYNFGNIDLGSVGAPVDQFDPPVLSFSGSFVDNEEGAITETTARRMRTDPGGGIFVDAAMASFNGTEMAAAMAKYMGGAAYPNTMVAEIHYKMTPCVAAFCLEPTGRLPNGFNMRGQDQGSAVDRGQADGFVNGGGGMVVDQFGPMVFEAFTVLVDLTARTPAWKNTHDTDVLAMSKVVYLNITVMPGVSAPVFNPPQDFYSDTINVTMESVSDDAHVFFTLQPPFIYDKDGTWCPHMGSWCSEFAAEGTFHAVPDQRPNFRYSQRGLFTRLFDVRSNETWVSPIPSSFPFVRTHAIPTTT